MNLEDVKAIIDKLERLNPNSENIYGNAWQILRSFSPLPLLVQQQPKDTIITRARPHKEDLYFQRIDQLIHPPREFATKFGRCNRPFQPVFYGSDTRPTAYMELIDYFAQDTEIGDEIFASMIQWSTLKALNFLVVTTPNSSKRTTIIEEKMGAPFDNFFEENSDGNKYFFDYMFDKFRSYAKDDIKTYAITTAYFNLAFWQALNQEYKIDGIMYPSVPSMGEGVNFALFPKVINADYFQPLRATRNKFEVDSVDKAGYYSFTERECFVTESLDFQRNQIDWRSGLYNN